MAIRESDIMYILSFHSFSSQLCPILDYFWRGPTCLFILCQIKNSLRDKINNLHAKINNLRAKINSLHGINFE